MNNEDLLQKLADETGYDTVDDMLAMSIMDSLNPGICISCEEYTTDVEPDQRNGWCEICDENKVQSCGVLAGIV